MRVKLRLKCPYACHSLPPGSAVHVVSCCEQYEGSQAASRRTPEQSKPKKPAPKR